LDEPENHTPEFERYESDETDDPFQEPPSEETDQLQFEKYVGAHIRQNNNGTDRLGIVKHRKRGPDGNLIGIYHEDRRLGGDLYEIKWEDGKVDAYFVNQIVESIMMNIDEDGNPIIHLKDSVDHKRDGSAVRPYDNFVTVNGKQKMRKTTKGWKICTELRDGSTEWIDLKLAKEAYYCSIGRICSCESIG